MIQVTIFVFPQARPLHLSATDGSRFIESLSHESCSAKRGCHIVLSTAKLEDGHTNSESTASTSTKQRTNGQQLQYQQQSGFVNAFRWLGTCRRRSTTPAAKSKYMEQFCICGSKQRRERQRRKQQQKYQLQQRRQQVKRSGDISETREDILHVSIEEWLTSQDGDEDDGDDDDNDDEEQQFLPQQQSSDEDDEYYFDGRCD